MPSDTVVKDFDVFEQAVPGIHSGFVLVMVDEFFLQRGEERFYRGVVPAVSFAAHRTRDAVFREQALIVLAGVLHSVFSLSKIRFAVCRCFFGAFLSASRISWMIGNTGTSTHRGRACFCRYPGGSACDKIFFSVASPAGTSRKRHAGSGRAPTRPDESLSNSPCHFALPEHLGEVHQSAHMCAAIFTRIFPRKALPFQPGLTTFLVSSGFGQFSLSGLLQDFRFAV